MTVIICLFLQECQLQEGRDSSCSVPCCTLMFGPWKVFDWMSYWKFPFVCLRPMTWDILRECLWCDLWDRQGTTSLTCTLRQQQVVWFKKFLLAVWSPLKTCSALPSLFGNMFQGKKLRKELKQNVFWCPGKCVSYHDETGRIQWVLTEYLWRQPM